MFNLEGTPYLLDAVTSSQLRLRLDSLEERVTLLRHVGPLTAKTLRDYYGNKQHEQVALTSAIPKCILSMGETELAVLKGITIPEHYPANTKDEIASSHARMRITELAREHTRPTDIPQLHEVHALLLGDQAGAGIFRRKSVVISGANHVPPRTWQEVVMQMEQWQDWSKSNVTLPAPIRAIILHAWLLHIHPYNDGNGRLSRAIMNLELIRSGYPPIIINKKERDWYIKCLQSDKGGDIGSFAKLVFDRIEGALEELELSAKFNQGCNSVGDQ